VFHVRERAVAARPVVRDGSGAAIHGRLTDGRPLILVALRQGDVDGVRGARCQVPNRLRCGLEETGTDDAGPPLPEIVPELDPADLRAREPC